jgi:hypothetical protein
MKEFEMLFDNTVEELSILGDDTELYKQLNKKVTNFNRALDKLSKDRKLNILAKVCFRLEAINSNGGE